MGYAAHLSTEFQAGRHKTRPKSTVNCGLSALVKRQHPFYFGVSGLSGWGHHEETSRWNRSDPRDPEPCRVCSGGQGQGATAGCDQGLTPASTAVALWG